MSFAAPFIGPAISAVGGLLGRGGGAGARQQTENLNKSEGNLQDVFNYAVPTSKAGYNAGSATTNAGLGATNQGLQTLSGPQSYWQRLMSGNRPAAMQALAPQTNAALQQGDAARRQAVASGTARGGGLSAPLQQQHSDMMAQIDNMLFGARSGAAQNLTQLGTTQAQVGLGEAGVGQDMVSKALQMLGLGTSATAGSGKLATDAFPGQARASQNTIGTLTGAAGDLFNNLNNKYPNLFGKGLTPPGGGGSEITGTSQNSG